MRGGAGLLAAHRIFPSRLPETLLHFGKDAAAEFSFARFHFGAEY